MIFGSFVGVNHHDQSTLLRSALMKNEDIQSFKWLFKCWLRCMGAKALKGIFTDQCTSMQRAIEMCMPTIIHRWHSTETEMIFSQSMASEATSGSQLNLLGSGPAIRPSSSFYNAPDMNYPGEDYTSS
ncbi:hypothetical protein Ahy_A03g015860 [Arachis hypogaea]|uniref:MULE transposase domain-containing protein n=1 Tax=Arachis hypogaea TaxID=3818 RepID=A0A445E1E5_ARAHY|nr:hypothetical protein Ahy_A03g015860 [Arachis hypogaea]